MYFSTFKSIVLCVLQLIAKQMLALNAPRFHINAYNALKHGSANMDVLVALGKL